MIKLSTLLRLSLTTILFPPALLFSIVVILPLLLIAAIMLPIIVVILTALIALKLGNLLNQMLFPGKAVSNYSLEVTVLGINIGILAIVLIIPCLAASLVVIGAATILTVPTLAGLIAYASASQIISYVAKQFSSEHYFLGSTLKMFGRMGHDYKKVMESDPEDDLSTVSDSKNREEDQIPSPFVYYQESPVAQEETTGKKSSVTNYGT